MYAPPADTPGFGDRVGIKDGPLPSNTFPFSRVARCGEGVRFDGRFRAKIDDAL